MESTNIPSHKTKRPFCLNEFKTLLTESEHDLGYTICQMESGNLVKSYTGVNEVYGRIRTDALESIFCLMDLSSKDIFIDLGHGIGTPSLQAAYTRGCESRGIELKNDRNIIAEELKSALSRRVELLKQKDLKHEDKYSVGNVTFKHGSFTEEHHSKFITSANKVFVNNACQIFACRSSNGGSDCQLDEYIAALFAKMKPMTKMITCCQITALGKSVEEENEQRVKLGLARSELASFFHCKRYNIGDNATTWGGDLRKLEVWLYTRTEGNGFLCRTPNCPGNLECTPNFLDDDKKLVDTCIFNCKWKRMPPKRLRKLENEKQSEEENNESKERGPKKRNGNGRIQIFSTTCQKAKKCITSKKIDDNKYMENDSSDPFSSSESDLSSCEDTKNTKAKLKSPSLSSKKQKMIKRRKDSKVIKPSDSRQKISSRDNKSGSSSNSSFSDKNSDSDSSSSSEDDIYDYDYNPGDEKNLAGGKAFDKSRQKKRTCAKRRGRPRNVLHNRKKLARSSQKLKNKSELVKISDSTYIESDSSDPFVSGLDSSESELSLGGDNQKLIKNVIINSRSKRTEIIIKSSIQSSKRRNEHHRGKRFSEGTKLKCARTPQKEVHKSKRKANAQKSLPLGQKTDKYTTYLKNGHRNSVEGDDSDIFATSSDSSQSEQSSHNSKYGIASKFQRCERIESDKTIGTHNNVIELSSDESEHDLDADFDRKGISTAGEKGASIDKSKPSQKATPAVKSYYTGECMSMNSNLKCSMKIHKRKRKRYEDNNGENPEIQQKRMKSGQQLEIHNNPIDLLSCSKSENENDLNASLDNSVRSKQASEQKATLKSDYSKKEYKCTDKKPKYSMKTQTQLENSCTREKDNDNAVNQVKQKKQMHEGTSNIIDLISSSESEDN